MLNSLNILRYLEKMFNLCGSNTIMNGSSLISCIYLMHCVMKQTINLIEMDEIAVVERTKM